LDQKKQAYEKSLIQQLQNIPDIALSVEFFENSRNSYFLSLRIHFYDSKFEYKTATLCFKRFIQSDNLSDRINKCIRQELQRLNISDKVRSITTDNSYDMMKATNSNEFGTRISCIIHSLNSTVSSALSLVDVDHINTEKCDLDFEDDQNYYDPNDNEADYEINEKETVTQSKEIPLEVMIELESAVPIRIDSQAIIDLINKVRKIIRFIKTSQSIGDLVAKEAEKDNIDTKLILDMSARWHSTYIMINRFLKYSKILDEVMPNELFKAIRLNARELILLKSLTEVLTPFYEQSLALQTKNFHSISFGQSVICELKKFLLDKSFYHTHSQVD